MRYNLFAAPLQLGSTLISERDNKPTQFCEGLPYKLLRPKLFKHVCGSFIVLLQHADKVGVIGKNKRLFLSTLHSITSFPFTMSSTVFGAETIFAFETLQNASQASFIHGYDSPLRIASSLLSRSWA